MEFKAEINFGKKKEKAQKKDDTADGQGARQDVVENSHFSLLSPHDQEKFVKQVFKKALKGDNEAANQVFKFCMPTRRGRYLDIKLLKGTTPSLVVGEVLNKFFEGVITDEETKTILDVLKKASEILEKVGFTNISVLENRMGDIESYCVEVGNMLSSLASLKTGQPETIEELSAPIPVKE